MTAIDFALYDAFSECAFGGSQAAVVSEAGRLDADARRQIVRELGLPAIGFVTGTDARRVSAVFQSTVMELPMCGHGTVALMTRMVEQGVLGWDGHERITVELCLPAGPAVVEISAREDGRPLVMLEVRPPRFRTDSVELDRLAGLLGLERGAFRPDLPIETALGDFVHLVLPVVDLAAMRRMTPDFPGLVQLCRDHGLETVAAFCSEVEDPESTLHVRDFCPAVGVAESAAAGTTNAALTSYLLRHGIVRPNGDGRAEVQAEQGLEIARPSVIRSRAELEGDRILRLQVGGVATKVADGQLHV